MLFIAALIGTPLEGAGAQASPTSLSESLETEAEPEPEPDPFNRESPRSTVTALLDALTNLDGAYIGAYFEIDEPSAEEAEYFGRALLSSLDAGGSLVPFQELSNQPAGFLSDGLDPSLEDVGALAGGAPAILLIRTQDDDGRMIWRVSFETLSQLRVLVKEIQEEPQASASPTSIESSEDNDTNETNDVVVDVEEAAEPFVIAGVPVLEWARLIAQLSLFVGLFAGASWLFLKALEIVISRKNAVYRLLNAGLPPLALFLGFIGFRVWAETAEVSIVGRQYMLRLLGLVAPVALAWFLMRLVDGIAGWITNDMEKRRRKQSASLVGLTRRVVKVAIFLAASLAILDTLGVDVTTGVAALGLGGLALALGAQKTIENLVGTVTVLLDRPVQAGDFCKVGDVLGTIEDIGIRSTRIRTLERTVVTIPNGDFSSLQIENYSRRDEFFFNEAIELEYALTADQLDASVAAIKQLLTEHDKVVDQPCYVTLRHFGSASLSIKTFTYLRTRDYFEALELRQEILFAIYRRLESFGVSIAFPTQTIYVRSEDVSGELPGPQSQVT